MRAKNSQALSRAVANRKVWGGDRTQSGAKAQSILLSVMRTATQRGIEALQFISSSLKAGLGKQPQIVPDTG